MRFKIWPPTAPRCRLWLEFTPTPAMSAAELDRPPGLLDSVYVDTAIRRWQQFIGRDAVHAKTGVTFEARPSSPRSWLSRSW